MSQKPPKTLKNVIFDSCSSFFSPGNPFSNFFRSFLGRGLCDPCRRPAMPQLKSTVVWRLVFEFIRVLATRLLLLWHCPCTTEPVWLSLQQKTYALFYFIVWTNFPCKPIPTKFTGADSPPYYGVSEAPCFITVCFVKPTPKCMGWIFTP